MEQQSVWCYNKQHFMWKSRLPGLILSSMTPTSPLGVYIVADNRGSRRQSCPNLVFSAHGPICFVLMVSQPYVTSLQHLSLLVRLRKIRCIQSWIDDVVTASLALLWSLESPERLWQILRMLAATSLKHTQGNTAMIDIDTNSVCIVM